MSTRTERWNEVSALFDELVDLESQERVDRLAQLARSDPELAGEVRTLLDADDTDTSMLDSGVSSAVPEILAGAADNTPADGLTGAYRLLRELGEGGMGVVWLAERTDGAYEQQVAVKLLKRGMDTHAILRRFLQERRILARLHHAHIVRLVDGGMSADGRPFYVMDHVDGEPITTYAARHRLDVRARVDLLVKVAEAVAYAHTQLIVHRDLKPSNVLVDDGGEPRVLDFGIAKIIEESGEQTLTGTGLRVLSPAYAAPEQILGEPIGTATDVYALGLMLFELLVGELPQRRRAANAQQLAQDAGTEGNVRASTLACRLPSTRMEELYGQGTDARRLNHALAGDLDLIIATALQRDPARRYTTAASLVDDLGRWLDRRPINARADSRSYRFRKFVRRHRVGVIAAALVVVSLVSGLGAALWQAGQARQQAVFAQQQAARAERVKAFLIAVFKQNEPALAKGVELSAAEILRRGRNGLEASMADDPATRGELLMAIAEIQGNLGVPADAIASADLAFPLMIANLAADDPRLAYAYIVRGELYDYADRAVEAERDLRAARAILALDPVRQADRLDHVDSQLAFAMTHTQSAGEAVTLQRSVVDRVRARLGDASPVLADHRVSLAQLFEDAGEYAEAEAEYRQALPVLTTASGTLAPRVCEAERNFAGLLDRLGRAAEAEPRFERALDCNEKLYGRESVPYARTLFSRGILLLNGQRPVDAEVDFRTVLSIDANQGNGAAHARRYLGRALDEQGRYAEAAREFAEAERLYREIDLPNDLQRWRARADFGFALFKTGDVAGGRAAIEAALAGLREEKPDGEAFEFMRPLRALGEVARSQGELDTAVQSHRRWRELAMKIYGADSRDAYLSAYHLGLDLALVGSPEALAEAESLIAEALPPARADSAAELTAMDQAHQDIVSRRAR